MILLLVLLAALGGCGKSGPEVAPVHGRVTLNGQPLASADVQFQPDGAQRPSTGRTDANGHYELMYRRGQVGALVGQHSVRISVSAEIVKNPPIIAAHFDTKTELHRDVKSGDNEFDFDVTTEKK
jgi:predicted small lipoprotein YifL